MPRLPLRTVENSPESIRASLATAEKSNGYLPNLLRVLANAPVVLETYLTVSGINARGSLSLAEREAVQITAAATHGCDFCVAAHSRVADRRGQPAKASITAPPDRTPGRNNQNGAISPLT